MFRIRSGGCWLRLPHPTIAGLLALGLPGVRVSKGQVAPFAAWWERQNAAPTGRDDPLWVVLGDSAAQGVGAARPEGGYVCQLAARLVAAGRPRMRILNISRSGARLAEVMTVQIPRLRALEEEPALVTCAIGVNDLLRTRMPAARRRTRALVAALPPGAVIATLPQALRQARAVELNAIVRAEAPRHGLIVADLWEHTGPPYRGNFAGDGFHPSERGYADWAGAFAEAILRPSPSPSP